MQLKKAIEVGVHAITPLACTRTTVKLSCERKEKRLRHWQQLVISACEQCGRTDLPTVFSPCLLKEWIAHQITDEKFIFHHLAKHTFPLRHAPPRSVALLIGPEGGFTEEEIYIAETHQFTPITLGPRILRTETAPIAAITLLKLFVG